MQYNHKKTMIDNIQKNEGAIALILVIMITTLTLVSSVVISLINTSYLISNYHISEAEEVNVQLDACIDDTLIRIVDDKYVSGDFEIDVGNVNCSSTISATVDGIKTTTSTATSTSDIGVWTKGVVMMVNVSSTPIRIDSYKDIIN